jgi:acyl-CoA thioester hydrolase
MPDIFEFHHTIADDEIDSLGHANNVAYVDWMQSAAVAHSSAQGWPGQRYRQIGQGWVVRSHQIEYLQPAFAGEEIVIRTWVATMRKVSSLRRYRILRAVDQAVLATAETLWAFIDYSTGQPQRIPAEVAESFQIVEGQP